MSCLVAVVIIVVENSPKPKRPLDQVDNDADWKNPAKTDTITTQILPDTDPLQQHPDQHDFRSDPNIDGKGWQRVAENDQATVPITLDTEPLQQHPDQHEFRSAPTIEDPDADWQRVEKSYNSKEEMPLDTEPSQGSSALTNPRAFDTLEGDLDWKHGTGYGAPITDQIAVDASPAEGKRRNIILSFSSPTLPSPLPSGAPTAM